MGFSLFSPERPQEGDMGLVTLHSVAIFLGDIGDLCITDNDWTLVVLRGGSGPGSSFLLVAKTGERPAGQTASQRHSKSNPESEEEKKPLF